MNNFEKDTKMLNILLFLAKEQGLRTNGIRRIYSDFTMIVTIMYLFICYGN